jgi:hypothetical protein
VTAGTLIITLHAGRTRTKAVDIDGMGGSHSIHLAHLSNIHYVHASSGFGSMIVNK